MRMLLRALILLVCTLGFGIGYAQYRLTPALPKRLNILIISFCSMRYQVFQAYGDQGPNLAPTLNKFFNEGSVVAENAFTSMGWTSVPTITGQNLPHAYFQRHGYKLRGILEGNQLIRVPERQSKIPLKSGELISDNSSEKAHSEYSEYFKTILTGEHFPPFFLVGHFKYMHYPLVDSINPEAGWDRLLLPEERTRVAEMKAHPERFYDKAPMLLYLFNDSSLLAGHPYLKSDKFAKEPDRLRRAVGLINNPQLLADWKASPGFDQDLGIINKIYKANFAYLDQVMAPHLDLHGKSDLVDNTVVIVIGDHGEVFMDHDDFTHGTSIFDPVVKVPFAIRFPGESGPSIRLKKQFQMNWIDDVVAGIVEGKLRSGADFVDFVERHYQPTIIMRDCNNSWRGLRHDNKWKYMVRVADGETMLFDLEVDPTEQRNVAFENPDVVADMEALYWREYPNYLNMDPMRCAPWVGQKDTAAEVY